MNAFIVRVTLMLLVSTRRAHSTVCVILGTLALALNAMVGFGDIIIIIEYPSCSQILMNVWMILMAVRKAVKTPWVHSSVPVLVLAVDSEQMELDVLVCTAGNLVWL